MSKRSGDFVSLDELLDDIGVDATRWFMLWRSHETTVDLDLELARSQSSENPVYYVQYAHARIASILRKAGRGGRRPAAGRPEARRPPLEPSEKALIKRLLEFPEEVREAAARRAPHRICAYSTAVAADFHAFYRDCQVVGAEGEGVEALAAGALPGDEADDRRRARAAGDLGARADVMLRRARQAARPGRDRRRRPGDARAWSLRRDDFDAPGAAAARGWPSARVVLVTGEGEAAAVAAIAARRGAAGRRAAARSSLECDLGRPRLAAELGLAPAPGLHEYLRWEAEPRPTILQPVALAGPAAASAERSARLRLRPAGRRPDPTTLLGLQSFRHMVEKLRARLRAGRCCSAPPLGDRRNRAGRRRRARGDGLIAGARRPRAATAEAGRATLAPRACAGLAGHRSAPSCVERMRG